MFGSKKQEKVIYAVSATSGSGHTTRYEIVRVEPGCSTDDLIKSLAREFSSLFWKDDRLETTLYKLEEIRAATVNRSLEIVE